MNNLPPAALWERAVDKLRGEIGDADVELWLKPVEPLSLDDRLFRIKVPNEYFLERIKDRYQKKLETYLKESTGVEVVLDYNVSKESRVIKASEQIPVAQAQSEFAFSELNPRYTFSTFVVGTSNRFAHATAEAICKNPGEQYNPFFLYGGVGLGKTHLMHAIGNELRKQHSRARVLYTTAEQFVNEFINSVKNNTPDAFRGKYRNLDCLLIDDVQFLIAKDRSEEEFFHTYNALFASRKQIVLASDRAPKEMAPSEQRLVSRLESGVVADIRTPDLETRAAILRKKVEVDKLSVPDDVILFIATNIKTSIRELEGALIRFSAFCLAMESHPTIDLAKEILKDSIFSDVSSPVRVEIIQKIVADAYSLEVRDFKSKSRTSEVSFPRQLAMYLACSLTELSTPDIGRAFGNRDHATVIHGRNKVKGMLEKDPFFQQTVNKLIEQIRSVENS